jgi:hypothetical protein
MCIVTKNIHHDLLMIKSVVHKIVIHLCVSVSFHECFSDGQVHFVCLDTTTGRYPIAASFAFSASG